MNAAEPVAACASVEAPSTEQALEELHRQIERGNLFAHTALGRSFARLGEAQAFLHGLADVLLAKGVITESELAAAIEGVQVELQERGELSGPGVMMRVDQETVADQPPVEVDCAARMHVCNAVCCRLDFALTVPEVESGRIKWDLGRPYFIRREANGCCAHNDPQSGGCRIYAGRPGVCRGYSCARDARIWKDFERMELNIEWIEAHLPPQQRPRAIGVFMHDAVPSSTIERVSP
jgi:hypothetical protein